MSRLSKHSMTIEVYVSKIIFMSEQELRGVEVFLVTKLYLPVKWPSNVCSGFGAVFVAYTWRSKRGLRQKIIDRDGRIMWLGVRSAQV